MTQTVTPPQNFWQKNQVLITGVLTAIAVALQQFTTQPTVDWKVVGFAALIAASSWAANNLRGKGISVAGLIGVAGYAISTTAINGSINWNQLVLISILGLIALVSPPPKTEAYEQSPTIATAKDEAKNIDATKK